MKPKTILIALLLLLFAIPTEAQWRDRLNRAAESIRNNETVQRATRQVQQADPKEYLKRKINENYHIQRYINDINSRFRQIERNINDNTTFYLSRENNFSNGFVTTRSFNNQLSTLDVGEINYKYPVDIRVNNRPFELYAKDNHFFAASGNSMPVNAEMRSVIATAFWAGQIDNLNSTYLNNLENLGNYTGAFSGNMVTFLDQVIYIFDALEDMEYMSLSAADVVDMFAQMHGYNFSVHDANQSFKSMRSEFSDIQSMAGRINTGCGNFLVMKRELMSTKTASYEEVQRSLNEFNTIASDLNGLAEAVAKKKNEIIGKRSEFSQLSNFSGITFIEDIGDLFGYLAGYFQTLEDGIRGHASNFSGFASEINANSDKYYSDSKAFIDQVAAEQLNEDLPYIQYYLNIRKNIVDSEFKNLANAAFTKYLENVEKMHSDLMKAKEEDFVRFHEIKGDLAIVYNDFPVADAKKYYESILQLIDDKQIIGGSYVEEHYNAFATLLDGVIADRSKVGKLEKMTKELDAYYDKAKSNNTTFFVVMAVVLVLIIAVIVFIVMKKRKKGKAGKTA